MSYMNNRLPAHDVILSMLHDAFKILEKPPRRIVTDMAFTRVLTLCELLDKMIIPDAQRAEIAGKLRDLGSRRRGGHMLRRHVEISGYHIAREGEPT